MKYILFILNLTLISGCAYTNSTYKTYKNKLNAIDETTYEYKIERDSEEYKDTEQAYIDSKKEYDQSSKEYDEDKKHEDNIKDTEESIKSALENYD